MMKFLIFAFFISISPVLWAQNTMSVYVNGQADEYVLDDTDSAYFNQDETCFYVLNSGITYQYLVSTLDSITFFTENGNNVYINYNGETASVINPLSAQGVDVSIDGADVIVTSTTELEDVNYILSGTTDEGLFKIYSDQDFNLLFNGVNITNTNGAPVNIQANVTITVNLVSGTENELTDGPNYGKLSDGVLEEDESATFFSEGELVINGSGELIINSYGVDQHGLKSDDELNINEGNITITTAVKDGIHGKDGFYMHGGNINVTSSGDGIDGSSGNVEISGGTITINSTEDDVKGIKCDSSIVISGGELNLYVDSDQSRGLRCDEDMYLNGGVINIETSGGVVLEASGSGYDPSYCSAIKGETDIYINGASINIEAVGEAGKGLSCDGNVYINGCDIDIDCSGNGARYTDDTGEYDAYHASCFSVDGTLKIISGNIVVHNSGSGGKGFSIDRNLIIGEGLNTPVIDVATTGSDIYISGSGHNSEYDEAKAVTVDGNVIINMGAITINSADDGIKADTSIVINHGNVIITNSEEGLESGNIIINGGNIEVHANDDAVNATWGNGGEQYDGSIFTVNDGYIYLDASSGDALDSNGDIEINGGLLLVHGPQSSPEVGMDVNGSCWVNGGFLVVSGTNSFMTEGPSSNSDQISILCRTNSSLSAHTLFHIEDENGNELVTFAPERKYYSMIFSSGELEMGGTYKIYTGGSHSGIELNGLYTGGTYSGGTLRKTFTINSTAGNINF